VKLTDLKSNSGARRKRRIVGRGVGSGHGKTSSRGNNGQGQRAGRGQRPGFEGGQTPLYRRLPKFQTNERPNRLIWSIVNLSDLAKISDCREITPEILIDKGIIDKINDGVKVLGNGELNFSVTIKANNFSKSAKKKIETAGGKWEIISKK